jgi:N-dimethylarginine dimethylaminohydrolase
MTPQFEGVRAYIEHAGAKYRAGVLGNMSAATAVDPDFPEFRTLFKGNSDNLVAQMRKDARRNLRDSKPKLWDEMVAEQDGLAETMRQCGVHVIRNEKCDTPDGLINMHDGWKSNKHMSVYAGPSFGRITRNIYFNTWDNSATGTSELHHRPGTLKLFEQNPDLVYYSLPYPEPNITIPGWGMLFQDVAGWRTMPDKHLLFGYGVSDANVIPRVLADIKYANSVTSAGIPQGADFMMRMLKREGFTHEMLFFDSRLTYHFDCFMMNIKEGVCGLPDLPDYGIMGGKLPECIKDWEILRIPVEDIKRGAANAITLGDGRVIIVRTAKETIKRMEKMGLEPIPVKYDKIWAYYHSGPDCSDADVWRENDPVKEIPDGPPPIA